ncbi:MAG: hypothetical protein AAFV29_14675, partial [Myxococcota bacterium]
ATGPSMHEPDKHLEIQNRSAGVWDARYVNIRGDRHAQNLGMNRAASWTQRDILARVVLHDSPPPGRVLVL